MKEKFPTTKKLTIASGEHLVKIAEALANPLRVKILGVLLNQRLYVSQLARLLQISRPLLYMHLQKLETAGLVQGQMEISTEGKATKYYVINSFVLHITPEIIAQWAEEIPIKKSKS